MTNPAPQAITGAAPPGKAPASPWSFARHAPPDAEGRLLPADEPIALEVWAEALDADTRLPTGVLKRLRMRSLGEVFADLHARLDVTVCTECGHEAPRCPAPCGPCARRGCGGLAHRLIDEYLAGPEAGQEGQPVPEDFRRIACYPVAGLSEGHYVHVEFVCPADKAGCVRLVRLALAKTFLGPEYACWIALRCAVLLGA
jgi:hypothetical protein